MPSRYRLTIEASWKNPRWLTPYVPLVGAPVSLNVRMAGGFRLAEDGAAITEVIEISPPDPVDERDRAYAALRQVRRQLTGAPATINRILREAGVTLPPE